MLNLFELHLEESDIVKSTIKGCFEKGMEPFGGLIKLCLGGLQIQMRVNKENK